MRTVIIYIPPMDTRQRPHHPQTATVAPRVIDSRQLLQPGQCLVIEHNGVRYTLRETRLSKLILTK